VIAEAGARLCTSRQRAAEIVERELRLAFAKLADQKLELGARYVAGGSADAALFREKLGACRESDRLRRSASFGPHRDDFVLDIDRQPAKHYASQGQQRLLALSLKMAELASVAQASRLEPILLLDDVSSELDPARTGAVYEFLRTSQSQVFVTTTRPELFVTPTLATDARADFVVREGRIFVGSD